MPFNLGKGGRNGAAMVSGAGLASGFARRASVDGESMNALRHERTEAIIYEAVSGHARQAAKTLTHQPYVKVTAFARAGVPGVQVTVVADFEVRRLQGSAQHRFDGARGQGHGWSTHEVPFGDSASPACGATCRLI